MKLLIALGATALASCATLPPTEAGPTAGLGQVAYINGLRIRPLQVLEDSRCPANVQCVWAGRLIVRARMNGPGWTQIRDFELGVFQAVDRYRVTLVSAEPAKSAPGPIEPAAYRYTFAVQGEI
jgi:hypothetical protein